MRSLSLALCLVLASCASKQTRPQTTQISPPDELVTPETTETPPIEHNPEVEVDMPLPAAILSFADLPGWKNGGQSAALTAFRRSCVTFAKEWAKDENLAEVWKPACRAAKEVEIGPSGDEGAGDIAARAFFEEYFVPQEVQTPEHQDGLLTAYYEPELEVRAEPMPGFDEPIYARPADLITVEPKRFEATGLKARNIMGRVVEGRLVPYFTRAEIIKNSGEALAWGAAVDVFFLQVQGSGRLRFADGRVVRAGFAGHNGLPYTSIGRVLIKNGGLKAGKASKGAIEKWMQDAGPQKARALMNHNKRYVFFVQNPVNDSNVGPIGTQGAPLTAGASLAVDPNLYPLGTPIWVDTHLPGHARDWKGKPVTFLAIAQDTGGAINGVMRGDLFLGSGTKAGQLAGIVKHRAKWWTLVPRFAKDEAKGPKS